MPSVQSFVATSRRPNICVAVIAFGFMRISLIGSPIFESALASTRTHELLPAPDGPMMHRPWRTRYCSYICTTLRFQPSELMMPSSATISVIAVCSSGYSSLSTVMPGKRSCTSDKNSGWSSSTSLDRFMSRSTRMSTITSLCVGLARLVEPHVRSTERMLRRPKS